MDAPLPGLLALTLRRPGATEVLLISRNPGPRGMGIVPERPRGLAASSVVMRLRGLLEGARLLRVEEKRDDRRLELAREGGRWVLRAERGKGTDALWLEAPDGEILLLEGTPQSGTSIDGWEEIPLEVLRERGPELERSLESHGLERARALLLVSARRALARLDRTLRAVEGDAARAETAPTLRRDAGLLLSHLHAIGPRDRQLQYLDWESEPPAERTLAFDPVLGPKAQAERWFAQARRLERGASIAAERWAKVAAEREAMATLVARIASAGDLGALEALAEEAERRGVAPEYPVRAGGGRARRAERLPYRRFASQGGAAILVGRGAADNDALTLRHSRPHDLWLHARGRAGAHVVVPLDRDAAIPSDLLVDAATLAAHFSDARGEETVDVLYTPRRYVHKRRGAAVGEVTVEREKVIAVRREPSRLERLLASERKAAR